MIVLDASALIEVIPDRPAAPWVLDQLEGAAIAAPAHQPAEVLSALGRLVRAEAIEVTTAHDAIADAAALQQELHVPTRAQSARALDLNGRVRVLDAHQSLPRDREGGPCRVVGSPRVPASDPYAPTTVMRGPSSTSPPEHKREGCRRPPATR